MTKSLKNIYEHHHQTNRRAGFSIMEKDRGELLKELVGEGKKILDLGCRDGALTSYFVKGNQVLGVDIDEQALNQAKDKLGIDARYMDLNGDWQELQGEKFNVIIAGEILEHLYLPEEVVKKVVKHLNSDGVFLATVPNAFSLKNRIRLLLARKKNTPLADPTHINHFSCGEVKNLVGKYFEKAEIIGLGRYQHMAKFCPAWLAFDLFIYARNPKNL